MTRTRTRAANAVLAIGAGLGFIAGLVVAVLLVSGVKALDAVHKTLEAKPEYEQLLATYRSRPD